MDDIIEMLDEIMFRISTLVDEQLTQDDTNNSLLVTAAVCYSHVSTAALAAKSHRDTQ